ncbi:MAG: DUF1294 domain-containing protein [Bacillota bacterium]|mgnify:CR=1 FL=1|jgi:uncharacterized membrane protein YsdA (DUF1294 family)|nr:DUF1294 domain-containing protein [Bacillota bacterium]
MKDILFTIVTVYISIMSIVGFVAMGLDKRKSIKRGWRISEHTLILIAFIGGGIGSYLGMKVFRHKTRQKKFIILIPLALLINIILWVLIGT